MSKVTARAHQPILQAIQLSPEMAEILKTLRRQHCVDQTQLQLVTEMVITLAVQNWDKIKPALDRDREYITAEDLPNCWEMWRLRVEAIHRKGFQP